MYLREMLLNSGLIDSNKLLELECTLKKYSKRININIKLENSLSFSDYVKFLDSIKSFLKPLNCGIFIDVKYNNMTLSLDELNEYTHNILNSLEESYPRIKALTNDEPIIDDKSISFVVACDARGLDDLINLVRDEFDSYMEEQKQLAKKNRKQDCSLL